MGNLEMGLELELTLKLNLELLESFLMQTYHLSAGTVAAVLEVCIILGALFHQRNLLLSEEVYWQYSFCLDLWKKTDSVD